MKKIITLVSLVAFVIIAALVYDLQVCIMLSKWFEFWADVIILIVVMGLYTGTMFECMRELRWQRWLDSFDKEDEK